MNFRRTLISLRRAEGYTLDQTILIVAIIAILVTLIIITVGWNLINKASGTKLAAQFKQIEDATGQFYANYRVWPDESYSAPATADSTSNMLALAGNPTSSLTYRSTVTPVKNYLPGYSTTGGNVYHNFGSGGTVTMLRMTNPYGLTGQYLVVEFEAVPFNEVQEAEKAIDGAANEDYTKGRVVAGTSDCINAAPSGVSTATPAGSFVYACYAANLVE